MSSFAPFWRKYPPSHWRGGAFNDLLRSTLRGVVFSATIAASIAGSSCPVNACDDCGKAPKDPGHSETVAPGITLHVFSDVTFRADRTDSTTGRRAKSQSYSMGQFDLYLAGSISPNVSILTETVLKFTSSNVAYTIELERAFIRYSWNDLLKISAGRTHTALGYWNEAFHHGALLQPTIARPEILRFGGVMPLHSVGVEVFGTGSAGAWDLSYIGNIANGRALDVRGTQGGSDVDLVKALALNVTVGFQGPLSLHAGPMFYRDRIPADPAVPGRSLPEDEDIVGGHVVGRAGALDLVGEYFRIRHVTRGGPGAWDHEGWYGLVLCRAGAWKPYAALDVTQFERGDPYLAKSDTNVRRYIAGLRFDVNHLNALRLEYRREDRSVGRTHVLALQTAFAF